MPAQGVETATDIVREVVLHQQTQRLDVERRDGPHARIALDAERSRDQREVDGAAVDPGEGLLGARRLDETPLESVRPQRGDQPARDQSAGGVERAGRERHLMDRRG